MSSNMRRLDRLEAQLGGTAEQDAADAHAATETLITRFETLVARLADPTSTMERIAWLASRDGTAAAHQLHTLIAERHGNART